MHSKNYQPNAHEIRFREASREFGCVCTGEKFNIQYHHIVGAAGKNNKIHIGQFYCIWLRWDLHDIYGEHPNHVAKNPKGFAEEFGTEKTLFLDRLILMQNELPAYVQSRTLPPVEVVAAIEGLRG